MKSLGRTGQLSGCGPEIQNPDTSTWFQTDSARGLTVVFIALVELNPLLTRRSILRCRDYLELSGESNVITRCLQMKERSKRVRVREGNVMTAVGQSEAA